MPTPQAASGKASEPTIDHFSHFTVGIPLQLSFKGTELKLTSVAIGYLPGRCVIIKHPVIAGLAGVSEKLFRGSELIVRYRIDEEVFGFRSQLIAITREPIKLLFLDYPKFLARCDLRGARRVQANLPAQLLVTRFGFTGFVPGSILDGTIRDMSTSGCCFCSDGSLEIASSIRVEDLALLRVRLPGTNRTMDVPGEARRVERNSRNITVGIRFHAGDAAVGKKIFDYMAGIERWEG